MPTRSFVLLCLIALSTLSTVTEASESKAGVKTRRLKKPSNLISASNTGKVSPGSISPILYNNAAVSHSQVDDFLIKSVPMTFNFISPGLVSDYPSYSNIDFSNYGLNQELLNDLLREPLSQDLLSSPDFTIPISDRFALLPFIYFHEKRLGLFKLFLKKFDYKKVDSIILSGLIVECRNDREYFLSILESQIQVIVGSFRSFWDLMLRIGASEIVENENEDSASNQKFSTLHQSFIWAFEYFATMNDEHQQPFTKHASLCIFNLLVDNPMNPFPESLLKEILKLPGIELNVSIKGSCVALFTLGLPQLPEYYPKLILSDDRLNVNCIVPSTNRSRGHITCTVPELPLFWHALIYLNIRALRILWANKNLHVLPLIPSFFKLLRLALLFLFFHFWDGRSFRGERRLA